MPLVFATFQGGLTSGTADENLAILEQAIQAIQQETDQLDLIAFPECFLQGYVCGKDHFEKVSEESDGPSSKKVAELARKYKVAIIYGYVEKAHLEGGNTTLYNSALCIDKSGKTLLNYRKTHLWLDYEKSVWVPGDQFEDSICEIEGHKIGLLICYDIEFPELSRILAAKGAQLVVAVAASCSADAQTILVPARAYENTIFIAYINRAGVNNGKSLPGGIDATFAGTSLVCDPCGAIIGKTDDTNPKHLILNLDFDDPAYQTARKTNPFFQDRRPDLYKSILK